MGRSSSVRTLGEPGEDSELWSACWRLVGTVMCDLRAELRERRLTPPQFAILRILRWFGPLPAGRLATILGVRPPTLTGTVDHLERRGLVRRTRSRGDRRSVKLAMSTSGTRLLTGVERVLEARWSTRIASVPSADRGRIVRSFQQLLASLDVGQRPETAAAPRDRAGRGAVTRVL